MRLGRRWASRSTRAWGRLETTSSFDHALDAEYLFPLAQGAALRQAFGPALGWDTDIAAIVSWDNAHAYWIASRWLGAGWRAVTPAWATGYQWRFAAELPLLALLSRPPAYRRNKQDAMTHLGFYREQVTSDYRDRSGTPYPYGYYFWIVPGVGFACWGHGGQFVLVVPSQRMVVVQVSLPDTDDLQGSELNDFLELVAPILPR